MEATERFNEIDKLFEDTIKEMHENCIPTKKYDWHDKYDDLVIRIERERFSHTYLRTRDGKLKKIGNGRWKLIYKIEVFGIKKDGFAEHISGYRYKPSGKRRYMPDEFFVNFVGAWEGNDDGNPPEVLSNGVYYYRITVKTEEGETASSTGKLVIMR